MYFRKYSGEKFCRSCFTKSIEEKVRKTINKYELLQRNDKIVIGLSGGKDSAVLLHILHKIESRFNNSNLLAITIDEGIEGYSSSNVEICKENTSKLGIKHVVNSFRNLFGFGLDHIIELAEKKGKKRLGACSYCGVLRRRGLNISARKLGSTKIVTAHNLDDEIQTIFLNLVRGDASKLAMLNPKPNKIHPMLIPRVKPLRKIPENEIVLYAHIKGIGYNFQTCPYAHEAMRGDIRVFLNEMENKRPGTKYTIINTFEKIFPSLEVQFSKSRILRPCISCNEPTTRKKCKTCELIEGIN